MIYLITTSTKLETDRLGYPELGSSRSPGYYFNFESADKCVRENNCDLFETCYDYAFIEEIEEGLYGTGGNRRWFYKYNHTKDEYEPIEEPEAFKYFFGFGAVG